jgi:hypothetical protein
MEKTSNMSAVNHEKRSDQGIVPAPKRKRERTENTLYITKNNVVRLWTTTRWHCIHNKQIAFCDICDGSARCLHKKQKAFCTECGGAAICVHNVQQAFCDKCEGKALCSHKLQKAFCNQCGGNAFCQHNLQKAFCVECGGSALCKHNTQKYRCYLCSFSKHSENWCALCKQTYVRGNAQYPYCLACYCFLHPDEDLPRRFMQKQNYVHKFLQANLQLPADVELVHNRQIDKGCSRRRPDWLIDKFLFSIIIECDENDHVSYSCENKRVMEIFEDLGNRPLIIIRFNPDQYTDSQSRKHSSCFVYNDENKLEVNEFEWQERSKVLLMTVEKYLCDSYIPTKEVTLDKLFSNAN